MNGNGKFYSAKNIHLTVDNKKTRPDDDTRKYMVKC
jgi:hypothetical protein